jgi:Holliday junction resolvase RusA-like endonuclease
MKVNRIRRGQVQAVKQNDSLHVRVDALTSQSGRFKSLIEDFLSTEFSRVRPGGESYEVVIEIERIQDMPAQDVDSVARAVLDALTGVVFQGDCQVKRLHVEKTAGERDRVKVRARPIPALQAA